MVPDESMWSEVPLPEVVFFQEGPGIRNWQYVDAGVPFLNIRCFKDGRLDVPSMNHVSEQEAFGKYSHFQLNAGDYVVSSSGTLGRVAEVYEEDLPVILNTSTIRFRPIDSKKLDRRYLKAFLQSKCFEEQILSYACGSAQLNYGPSHLCKMYIPLPSLPEQTAIGGVLGALEDRIDYNRALAANLEAIARRLYKSWFVDFDPVRAKAAGEKPPGLADDIAALFPDRFVESELGEIPEGWEVGTVGDLSDVVGGTTPSTKELTYWDGGTHAWATPKDLSALLDPILLDTERQITDAGLSQISSGLLPKGTILLSSRAPIGYLAITEVPVAINQGFIAMKPKAGISNIYLLLWASVAHEEIVSRANGSTFLEISKANFRPIPVIKPTTEVMQAFDQLARPLHEKVANCARESRALSQVRDLLLPRLISGELRVPEVTQQIEGALA